MRTNCTTSNHNTVFIRFVFEKTEQVEKEEVNCFSTVIQRYSLDKLTDEGWALLNAKLALED